MTDAQQTFAGALQDFGCGSDEDSLLIGDHTARAAQALHVQPPLCTLLTVLDMHDTSVQQLRQSGLL